MSTSYLKSQHSPGIGTHARFQTDAWFGDDPLIGFHYVKVALFVLLFLLLLPALLALSTLAYIVLSSFSTPMAPTKISASLD
jgi:hypothetical protein